MSRTKSNSPRCYWVAKDGAVMKVTDGVSVEIGKLTIDQVNRLRRSGWTIGSSTRRYTGNPLNLFNRVF